MSGILLLELHFQVQLMNATAGDLIGSMFIANINFDKSINKIDFYLSPVSFQSGLCALYKICS